MISASSMNCLSSSGNLFSYVSRRIEETVGYDMPERKVAHIRVLSLLHKFLGLALLILHFLLKGFLPITISRLSVCRKPVPATIVAGSWSMEEPEKSQRRIFRAKSINKFLADSLAYVILFPKIQKYLYWDLTEPANLNNGRLALQIMECQLHCNLQLWR
jgi:hypothetical protein